MAHQGERVIHLVILPGLQCLINVLFGNWDLFLDFDKIDFEIGFVPEFSDMNRQTLWANLWFLAAILLTLSAMAQEFPSLVANPRMSTREMMHLGSSLMLKPWNLLPWIVLVTTGIAWTWRRRDIWQQDRSSMYVFAMCSFSVVWFVVTLVAGK
jgi:hypothetical protein